MPHLLSRLRDWLITDHTDDANLACAGGTEDDDQAPTFARLAQFRPCRRHRALRDQADVDFWRCFSIAHACDDCLAVEQREPSPAERDAYEDHQAQNNQDWSGAY